MKPSYLRTLAVFCTVLAASCTWAYTGLQTKLSSTDFAETVERDSKAYINVIGTGEADPGNEWGWSKDVVYDGKVHMSNNAWFEPSYVNGKNSGAWAGFGTKTAASVTKIRYYARNDGTEYAARAIGLRFQGATDAEFLDAVTLYTIPEMSLDDLTNRWQEVYLEPSTAKYTFFRIFGDYGGNLCEAEFYGTTEDLSASSAPAAPAFSRFALINGKLTYAFTAQADAYAYRVERRYAGESDWEVLASHIYIDEGASVAGMVDCYLPGPADYRLVAVNLAGETASALESVAYYKPLKGATIQSEEGDVGSVFDGDIATGYQSSGVGQWLGLDLGAARSVCGVRLMPKSSGDNWYNEYDSVSVADDASFTDERKTDALYASWSGGPAYGFVTNYSFAAIAGSCVRYIAQPERKCSLAEIEFLTDEWTPDAAPGGIAMAGTTLTWNLPDVACMSSRVVRTTAQYGGSDVQTFDLRGDATSWTDTTAKAGVTYYYRVQSVNNVGGVEYAGPASAQVSYRFLMQIERDENDQSQLRSGMTAYASDGGDASGMFDGSVSWDSWPDLSSDVKVGVNLGAEYIVERFRFYPRYDSYGLERCNGAVLATDSGVVSAPCEISTEPDSAQWYEFATTDQTPASLFYMMRNDGNGFYGNVAELQLFGYLASDAAGVVVAPTAAAAWSGSRVSVSWEGGSNAVSCDVERSEDGGTTWTTLASGVTGTQWIDATANFRKSYVYRLKANGTANYAYSSVVAPSGVGAPRGMTLIIK